MAYTCPNCQLVFKTRGAHPKACGTGDSERRFWLKVDKSAGPDGCWLYTGFIKWDGYGWTSRRINGKPRFLTAHRYAWILTRGVPPAGMVIRHKCDRPACCNPAHLELGSRADNSRDAYERRRHAFGERNAWAKLTFEKVAELRLLRDQGWTFDRLSRKFGVSSSACHYAYNGRTWKIKEKAGPKQNMTRPRRAA